MFSLIPTIPSALLKSLELIGYLPSLRSHFFTRRGRKTARHIAFFKEKYIAFVFKHIAFAKGKNIAICILRIQILYLVLPAAKHIDIAFPGEVRGTTSRWWMSRPYLKTYRVRKDISNLRSKYIDNIMLQPQVEYIRKLRY